MIVQICYMVEEYKTIVPSTPFNCLRHMTNWSYGQVFIITLSKTTFISSFCRLIIANACFDLKLRWAFIDASGIHVKHPRNFHVTFEK